MRVLAVSDRVVKRLESPQAQQHFGSFDLILGAGDLPYAYLAYLADAFSATCLFVAGNHDAALTYDQHGDFMSGPRGWQYLSGRAAEIQGFLVAGLSGSINYNPGKPFHYSQSDMWLMALRIAPALTLAEMRRQRTLDCLLTHSPAEGIGDREDFAHQGFRAMRWLLDRFRPRYHVHGHIHLYGNEPARQVYRTTQVINAYGFQIIDTEKP